MHIRIERESVFEIFVGLAIGAVFNNALIVFHITELSVLAQLITAAVAIIFCMVIVTVEVKMPWILLGIAIQALAGAALVGLRVMEFPLFEQISMFVWVITVIVLALIEGRRARKERS